MNRYELIDKCQAHLGAAQGCANTNDHEHYAKHMAALLDLLMVELVGGAPNETQTKIDHTEYFV